MRFGRETFIEPGKESFRRFYIFSEFGGPWPDLTLVERNAVVGRIEEGAQFAGLVVKAYCVTGRSFHLLIDEPRELALDDEEMFRRFQGTGTQLFENEKELLENQDLETWKRLRQRFGDIGTFMKRVKQVTAQQYHRERGTSGMLWQSRYASSFVQPGQASQFVAAWLAFANVRNEEASMVAKDKLNFYGRAKAGDKWSRAMIGSLYGEEKGSSSWQQDWRAFQGFIESEPENFLSHPEGSKRIPYLSRAQAMRVEIANFAAGMAIGDKEYLESFFEANRKHFGAKRTSGARHVVGQNDPSLWTARLKVDLRKL